MVKDIQKLKKEIFEFLEKENSIKVFYVDKSSIFDCSAEPMIWNRNKDYKGYFEIAKHLGIKLFYYFDRYSLLNLTVPAFQLIFYFEGTEHILLVLSDENQKKVDESIKPQSKEPEELDGNEQSEEIKEYEIPKEKLCRKCEKKEITSHLFYCDDCLRKLTEEADKRKKEIIEELSKDSVFVAKTNDPKRKRYVEKRYGVEAENNRCIHLKEISIEAYAEYEINKEEKREYSLTRFGVQKTP